jgi:hypothetical protein
LEALAALFRNWRRDRIPNFIESRLQIHSQGGPQKPAQLDGPDAKLKIALIPSFGALLTLLLFHIDLNIYAFVGLIMLFGIVEKERHHAD